PSTRGSPPDIRPVAGIHLRSPTAPHMAAPFTSRVCRGPGQRDVNVPLTRKPYRRPAGATPPPRSGRLTVPPEVRLWFATPCSGASLFPRPPTAPTLRRQRTAL